MINSVPWKGAGFVLAAMVLSGTVGPAQVLVGDAVGPTALGGWRHLISGVALCALAAVRGRSAYRKLRGRRTWTLLVGAGLLSVGHQVSFLEAVSRTGAALGTVVAVATIPLFAGIAARFCDRERLTGNWLAGAGTAVVGCAVLLLPGAGARVDIAGVGFGVLAGLVFAGYTVVSKRLADAVPDVTVSTGVSMLIGGVVLLPVTMTDTDGLGDLRTGAVILWLGLLAIATYGLYFAGLRHVTTNVAGTLSLAEPLAAVLISTALLGERLSGVAWAAGAVILAGILVATVTPGRRTPVGAVGVVVMPLGVPLRPDLVGIRLPAVGRARPGGRVIPNWWYSPVRLNPLIDDAQTVPASARKVVSPVR